MKKLVFGVIILGNINNSLEAYLCNYCSQPSCRKDISFECEQQWNEYYKCLNIYNNEKERIDNEYKKELIYREQQLQESRRKPF